MPVTPEGGVDVVTGASPPPKKKTEKTKEGRSRGKNKRSNHSSFSWILVGIRDTRLTRPEQKVLGDKIRQMVTVHIKKPH